MAKTADVQVGNYALQAGIPVWLCPGIVTGGGAADESTPRIQSGIAGQEVLRAGTIVPKGSLELICRPETKTLMQKALRAAPWYTTNLPELMFQMGHEDRVALYSKAKIASLSGKWSDGEALNASLEFAATGVAYAVVGGYAQVAGGSTDFEEYDGYVKVDGANMEVISIDWSVSNELEPRFTLDSRVTGVKRFPSSLREGKEKHEISIEYLTDEDYDFYADAPAKDVDVVLYGADNAVVPNTITLTWSGLMYAAPPTFAYVAESGDHVWSAKLAALAGCLAIT